MNTNRKTPLQKWLTYQSAEFGYSFSYPEDWVLTNENVSGIKIIHMLRAPNSSEDKPGNQLNITISGKPADEDFRSPFPATGEYMITINGKSYARYNTGSTMPIYSVYVLEKNIGIEFNYIDYPLNNPNTGTIESIVKSFKF